MKTVLVSLPVSFPTGWVGTIWTKAASLGIDGRIFHGVPTLAMPQISNVEYEARQDMYAAMHVFAAITRASSGEIVGDWAIKYLQALKDRRIGFQLALVGIEFESLPSLQGWILPNAKVFETPETWLDSLFKTLETLQ